MALFSEHDKDDVVVSIMKMVGYHGTESEVVYWKVLERPPLHIHFVNILWT